MSNKLAEKKKSFSFKPSILKVNSISVLIQISWKIVCYQEFERNSRLCNDVVSSWSKNLNRSTEDGKVKLNIRSETDIQRQAMRKVTHQKSLSTGRKYTSKVYYLKFVKFLLFPSFQYRGVHQTFPTRRWEAQFRKGGKVRNSILKIKNLSGNNFCILANVTGLFWQRRSGSQSIWSNDAVEWNSHT